MHDIFIKLATAFLEKISEETNKHTSEKATIKVEYTGVCKS